MKKRKTFLGESLKQEFKKDLELFQYFLVLLNSSSPIRNVELMWAEDLELFDPAQRPRLNTEAALVQLQPIANDGQGRSSPSPSTHFCDLVHGFGSYEQQTCARSDNPAKERCRATGCSHVYPCHVGLTDIAVPVICDGRYLGTLFSGQVVTEPPSPEGFAAVCKALEGQPHIDWPRLEKAYYRVPVVTTAQLAEMVHMLEVFARYLANAWKRLEIMSELQQVREREISLDRRELAELLLSRNAGDAASGAADRLWNLARKIGMERLPDRIFVLRLQTSPKDSVTPLRSSGIDRPSERAELGTQLALARVGQIIEDRCRNWPNTLAAVVEQNEICIFTSQSSKLSNNERMLLEEIGQTLLRILHSEGLTEARIGISGLHQQPAEMLRAYREAIAALDSGRSGLTWFEALTEVQQRPAQSLAKVMASLQTGDPALIGSTLREFLTSAVPASVNATQLQQARGVITWACEHLAQELSALGVAPEPVSRAKEQAVQTIISSPGSFDIAQAFRAFVEEMRLEVLKLFSQRDRKIVSETQRLVREIGPDKATIHRLAGDLQLSAGHLGRVYSRTTGHTLEEYLIQEKLEMGKRLLLDPRLHVSEVADRCGFCNPAYFASVFKKYVHCTPRMFANDPQRWAANRMSEPEGDSLPNL